MWYAYVLILLNECMYYVSGRKQTGANYTYKPSFVQECDGNINQYYTIGLQIDIIGHEQLKYFTTFDLLSIKKHKLYQ